MPILFFGDEDIEVMGLLTQGMNMPFDRKMLLRGVACDSARAQALTQPRPRHEEPSRRPEPPVPPAVAQPRKLEDT